MMPSTALRRFGALNFIVRTPLRQLTLMPISRRRYIGSLRVVF